MSTPSATPNHVAALLLPSLRRDAYVMEANAYGDPSLPESNEAFKDVFGKFYDQLTGLFDKRLTALLAIDSRGKSSKAIVAFRDPTNQEVLPADSPVNRLSLLAGHDEP